MGIQQGVENILAYAAIVKDHAEEKCFMYMFILLYGPLLSIFLFCMFVAEVRGKKIKRVFLGSVVDDA